MPGRRDIEQSTAEFTIETMIASLGISLRGSSIILFNLHLWVDCRLADLVGLTKLVIGGNTFSEGKLPLVVYELKNLKELFLAGSGLVEIDERYSTDHQRTCALCKSSYTYYIANY